MEIKHAAVAGTMESSDILISVKPGEGGLSIALDSVVKRQFGRQIEASIREVCASLGVQSASIYANDRGALDCVVRARVEAALLRAGSEEGKP